MIDNDDHPVIADSQGVQLVRIARSSIQNYLNPKIKINSKLMINLAQRSGIFVTLYSCDDSGNFHLRGCVGYPFPNVWMTDSVTNAAIKAATEDTRFRPVTINELQQIIVEVSILSTPVLLERIHNFQDKILIGKHGLIIESHFGSGILLPQVAIECHFNSIQFLENVCLKAGLTPESWHSPDVKLYLFETSIFREITPGGEIIRVRYQDKRSST